ncbi:MAG: multiple sugar transport system substrate-binding protein [Nocardioidaceae bacterium]|nr:multiple sugar transport system substrate-binding protein [Nocardioidaceae bacterium]
MKSPKLRRALLAIGPVLGLLAVASCGGGSSSTNTDAGKGSGTVAAPKKPVTITFQSWVNNDQMKKFAADFHKKNPTITIKLENVNADSAGTKLTTQIAAGEAPDTAYLDLGDVADFASRQALVNLDNYIGRSTVVKPADFIPAFKTPVTYNNSIWGLPFDGETTGLFYRTDLFKAAGIKSPPKTWSEFYNDAKKLTIPSKKQYGFALFANEAYYYWYPWLYQAGGDLLSKDGKSIAFDSPAAQKAAEFYVSLVKFAPPDYLNSDSYTGGAAFANGQSAMYMAGSWFASYMDSSFPKIKGKWATAPLPSGTAGCKTTTAGDALVITSNTKNADAAWKWIEYLDSPKNVGLWTYGSKDGSELPPLQSLLGDAVKTKPVLKGFVDLMKCGVSGTVSNPKFPKIQEALNTELGKAFYGDETAKQALANAAQQGQQILAH